MIGPGVSAQPCFYYRGLMVFFSFFLQKYIIDRSRSVGTARFLLPWGVPAAGAVLGGRYGPLPAPRHDRQAGAAPSPGQQREEFKE